jgi:hypothetical protein
MFKFKSEIEEFFREILGTEEVSVVKSNPQSPQCWNENHCEVEIEDENGGRLVLKISISEKTSDEITGEIVETWYWDEEMRSEPVVVMFPAGPVVISYSEDDWECKMRNIYGGNIIW